MSKASEWVELHEKAEGLRPTFRCGSERGAWVTETGALGVSIAFHTILSHEGIPRFGRWLIDTFSDEDK